MSFQTAQSAYVKRLQTAEARPARANSPRHAAVAPRPALLRLVRALPPGAALACSVLVLNRLYMAVHIVNVRRAFGLLCRELAEVIHLEDGKFATYSFDSWREISELRAEGKQAERRLDSGGQFRNPSAAGDSAVAVRPAAKAETPPQPPQRAGTRRPRLPILRPALSRRIC